MKITIQMPDLYSVRCVLPRERRARKTLVMSFTVMAKSRDEAIELARNDSTPRGDDGEWSAVMMNTSVVQHRSVLR